MPTVRLVIKGRVQGVFYRATAKDVADEMEIKGWVRNTEEGNVEITATASEEQLQQFITWCKKGPPRAVVTEVTIDQLADEQFEKFRIIKGG